MSLSVYLHWREKVPVKHTGVYIRKNGSTVELTEEEVKKYFPDFEPQPYIEYTDKVFNANITHNLYRMASECGIAKYLWDANEIGITKAKELIEPLTEGLKELKARPKSYKQFNPVNGWGTYENLVDFVGAYLEACKKYPEAKIEVDK